MRWFRREFDGLDLLPPNAAERVAGLWTQVIAASPRLVKNLSTHRVPI